MTAVEHPVSVASRRRPRPVLRWLVAGTVAFPELWTVVALVVGSFGLNGLLLAEVVVVLVVAVFVGLGHRWAYAAAVVLGLAAVVGGTLDPGMLVLASWVFGGLYVLLGLALLVASRRGRPGRRADVA